MSNDDSEAIRSRLVLLLDDAEALARRAKRRARAGSAIAAYAAEVQQTADRMNRTVRELYHVLPGDMFPIENPRFGLRDSSGIEGQAQREKREPTPGGKLPREVRWPSWTIEQILELADQFMAKHGKWPNRNSGRIRDDSPDTWCGIDIALKHGNRDLPGGTSLAKLLEEHRGAFRLIGRPPLTVDLILAWVDEYHAREETWPTATSGSVAGQPHTTWKHIDSALRKGLRGLAGGSSLARLLTEKRGVLHLFAREPLTETRILMWADAHYARTGKWPTKNSGDVAEAPGEDWRGIDNALRQGHRSLPPGSSLARLLASVRDVRNRKAAPHLEIEKILEWADLHFKRHGRWPTCWSGTIEDAPGETWNAVDSAMKVAGRGLAGCGYRSLAHLLDERRGKLKHHGSRPAERIRLD